MDSRKWTVTNTEAIVIIRRRLWTGWSLALTGYYPLGRISRRSAEMPVPTLLRYGDVGDYLCEVPVSEGSVPPNALGS